ncbi:MAG: AAA family ATPase [Candidatus Kapaibacterium sp.]
MGSLEHFLGGGNLPFAGRKEEIRTLLSFWLERGGGDNLRTGLIIGEAGCGKSRLVEELLPQVIEGGGVVVHAKLRPEGIASIGALIAPALWGSDSAGKLLKGEPEPTLSSAVSTLKRVASLRRTLLVIEDIHLLQGMAAREFAMLPDQLSDEPILFLTTSRFATPELRSLIGPSLSLELNLNSLSRSGVAEIWDDLFGTLPTDMELNVLVEGTLGNPLALRSALRGAVNSGALILHDDGGVLVVDEIFADVVERSAERMTLGMIAHLSAEEQDIARLLAWLGESFSVEGARALVGEKGMEGVEKLREEGVLVEVSDAVVSVNGVQSAERPLAFSHSLLHSSLLEKSTFDPELFFPLLVANIPLYTITPYDLLSRSTQHLRIEGGRIIKALEALTKIALRLNETSDWNYAMVVYRGAEALMKWGVWSGEEEQLLAEAALLALQIRILRRRNPVEEYEGLVDQYLEMVQNLIPYGHYEEYIYALLYLHAVLFQKGDKRYWSVQERLEEYLSKFPDARYTFAYIDFIRELNHNASIVLNREYQKKCEVELDNILRSDRYTPEMRSRALQSIGSYLLLFWETEEELERREEIRLELDRLDGEDLIRRPWTVIYLLWDGRAAEALKGIERLESYYRKTEMFHNYWGTLCLNLAARAMLGAAVEEVDKSFHSIASVAQTENNRTLFEQLCVPISTMILVGEVKLIGHLISNYDFPVAYMPITDRYLLQVEGEIPEALWRLHGEPLLEKEKLLWRMLEEHEAGEGISAAIYEEIIQTVPVRTIKVMNFAYVAVLLIVVRREIEEGRDVPTKFVETFLRPALLAALEWFRARGLTLAVRAMAMRGANLLLPQELQLWQTWSSENTTAPSKAVEEKRLRIGMFGNITYSESGGQPTRLRGGRNHTLLGTLVADNLLKEPMERVDFIALATGDESDPDRARRSMNVAVLRLREALGKEAILTEGETPQLNLEDVSVDLLEAYDSLRLSRKSLRKDDLRTAREELTKVLKLWNGHVPFPGLYADLFEELREQFETGVRNTIISVGEGLLKSEDNEAAESLLGSAFGILPEDEEIGELLKVALVGLGKYADSGSVKVEE